MQSQSLEAACAAFPPSHFLLTGAEGMLGHAFATAIRTHLPHCELRALGHRELDVTDANRVLELAEWIRGGWIIHCAGLVNVEGCAADPVRGERAIVQGTSNVCALSQASDARVFYPQTFLIYDGVTEPIVESTPARPLSLYGELKLRAEAAVVTKSRQPLVVRMGGFFGGEHRDKNFVGTIIPSMRQALRRNAPSSIAIGSRVWQPTYTADLALNSLALIVHRKVGVYQMACHGQASFAELASEVVKLLQMELTIAPAAPFDQADDPRTRRPARAVMMNRRLQTEGLDFQRPWREALREYLSSPYFQGPNCIDTKTSPAI